MILRSEPTHLQSYTSVSQMAYHYYSTCFISQFQSLTSFPISHMASIIKITFLFIYLQCIKICFFVEFSFTHYLSVLMFFRFEKFYSQETLFNEYCISGATEAWNPLTGETAKDYISDTPISLQFKSSNDSWRTIKSMENTSLGGNIGCVF